MPVNGHPAFEMAYNLGSWNAQQSTLLFADKAYRLGDRIVLIGAGGDLGAHFLAAAPPDIRECGLSDVFLVSPGSGGLTMSDCRTLRGV